MRALIVRFWWAPTSLAAAALLLFLLVARGPTAASLPVATPPRVTRPACSPLEPFNPPLVAVLAAQGVPVLDRGRGVVLVVAPGEGAEGSTLAIGAFDTTTGRRLRSTRLVTPPLFPGRLAATAHSSTSVVLSATAGRLFVLHAPYAPGAPLAGRVDVVDEARLTLVRTVRVDPLAVAPVVDERTGRVFVVSPPSGSVSVLDAQTGRLLRTTRIAPGAVGVETAPLVAEPGQRVFVATPAQQGSVSVLDARTGAVLRRVEVGSFPQALALDGVLGHVLVGNHGSRTVSVLDARTGALLATAALPGSPVVLAASATTHRAFVSYDDYPRVSVIGTAAGALARNVPVRLEVDVLLRAHATPRPQQVGDVPAPIVERVDELRRWAVVRVPEIVDDDGIEPGSAQIAVLDSRTGTRIHSLLAQEAWPEAAGIDDQRGRAVAVVSGAVLVYDISCLKSYYILGDLG